MPFAAHSIRAVVVDFDGTVVDQDVSEEILRAFAPPQWWDIDLEFQRGAIGSRECLVRQAALLRGSQAEMLRFSCEGYRLDPTFLPFVRWARDHGITVGVATDGLGFYAEPMLRAAGIRDVAVRANRTSAGPDGAIIVSFPEGHPVCTTCGACKMSIVQRYRAEHGPVAFVGEGHTDRYGALYADLVFAKKHLPAICLADGVPFVEWSTFDDVRDAISRAPLVVPRAHPLVCPGWNGGEASEQRGEGEVQGAGYGDGVASRSDKSVTSLAGGGTTRTALPKSK